VSGSYQNLTVWQRSIELSVAVYELTRGFPSEELYGMTSQLRRAAISISSNIAEGYGRASRPEFRRFLAIARGSAMEVQSQLVVAKKLDLGNARHAQSVDAMADEVGRMLWALMGRLTTKC
jgi:four helix bundle protein